MPTDAGIRFGQYVLVRRIARGGMAEVFLAQQRGLEGFDRRVAVKRILPHLADSSDFVKMFFGEARLAAQLSHPNIVHIYEFGKVEQDYFIAMEFVDGVHAGQLFKHGTEKDKLSPTLIARIGADAANALHYAHELRGGSGTLLGLVHRDVSPANIMVSFDGVVKLCDFGIAKAAAAGDQLTNPGQVKGKYAYMSPEQTIASQLDGRSDVFSLAIVMWELLAGKYIVPRGDPVAAMRAIRDGKLEPIEKVNPQVPAPLATAISWALEPKREKRATAAEFAQALEAFLKSAPDLATSMQLGGWIRARFPREGTGQMPAIDPAIAGAPAGPGTHASPGTFVAPGTAVASPHTMVAPGTPVSGLPITPPLLPPRRVVRLVTDTADGTEIYSTADSDLDDETAETIKGARPLKLPPQAQTLVPPTQPRGARASVPPLRPPTVDEPTLHAPPPVPRGNATAAARNARVPADEEDSDIGGETIQRDVLVPVPSGPTVVPTRVQPQLDPRAALDAAATISDGAARVVSSAVARAAHAAVDSVAHALPTSGSAPAVSDSAARSLGPNARLVGPRGPLVEGRRTTPWPGELARKRRKKLLIAFGGLAGLAVLSFAIALAASSSKKQPVTATPRDAEPAVVVMAPMPTDAALPIAPPPADAAPAPTIPTVAPDAGLADEGMAYLVVRTIPDGGNVKVGDQSRVATVQPGDPTGAATAQLLLPPGKHVITAELDGYRPEKRAVVLEAGLHQKIEITFTNKIMTRPDRGPAMGRLTVRTTPWSDVYLGGKKLGQAPFADLELPAGTHTLTFKNPSRPTVTKTVTIKAGRSAKLNFNL